MIYYLLAHEYDDKSAFNICGLTSRRDVANAWFNGSEENNIYNLHDGDCVSHFERIKGWKELKIVSAKSDQLPPEPAPHVEDDGAP